MDLLRAYLSGVQFTSGYGHHHSLVSLGEHGTPDMFATTWVDRDCKYFIGTREESDPGMPDYHVRWRQLQDMRINEAPVCMMMEIPMPKIVESYFSFCSKIDGLNSQRQKQLEMERFIRTKDWWKRVSISFISTCMVDATNFHQLCKPYDETDTDLHD